MSVQIYVFSRLISIRGRPDRGSCGGRLSIFLSKSGIRPDLTALRYRRATTRTGELDGAKGTDGG